MEPDLFRDTPVRYLGYSNEIGEAFRPIVSTKLVWFSYGIACGYVVCDAAEKGFTDYKQSPETDADKRKKQALLMACDALVWQTLASVVLPGATINRISWATRRILVNRMKMPKTIGKSIAVSVGLLAIPFIIKPIDNAVDLFMGQIIRPWLLKKE